MTDDAFFHAAAAQQRQILTVGQLNRKVRQLLEVHLPLIWVEGELSNFSRPSSGHWYFTLKDSDAQVRCAMFRNRNQQLRFAPRQGQKVLIRARVSLYEGRGDYQLIAEHMEESGLGALQQAFDALKLKLQAEGLFDPRHKQAIPPLPRHIGVITSPTGAAIRDILHVTERRFPAIPVSVFPVAVQGSEAAGQIVRALDCANRLSDCDLLIVGRGGGSLEDLWPFNEEAVARAIFASRIPVISAVGHEVDFTIADFVADLRAPTPSAAAEMATPSGDEMLNRFCGYEVLLEEAMQRRLLRQRERLQHLSARLQHPGQKLRAQAQQLDNLEIRLQRAMRAQLQHQVHRLQQLSVRQTHIDPRRRISQQQLLVTQLQQRLQRQMTFKLKDCRQLLGQQAAVLESVNPLAILQRGYSVTKDDQGGIVTRASQLRPGDVIHTRLADGQVRSRVEESTPAAE